VHNATFLQGKMLMKGGYNCIGQGNNVQVGFAGDFLPFKHWFSFKNLGKFACSRNTTAKNLQNFVSPTMAKVPEGSGCVSGTNEDDLHFFSPFLKKEQGLKIGIWN
jgi:hypothetical protein